MTRKRLKKDIVIGKGTIFRNCDDSTVKFVKDNYECVIGLSKDSSGLVVYGIDCDDHELMLEWFEDIPND